MLFHQLHFHSYRIPIPNSQQNFINNIVFTPEEALHVVMEESTMLTLFSRSLVSSQPSICSQVNKNQDIMTHEQLM